LDTMQKIFGYLRDIDTTFSLEGHCK
jgi:hypothetical protein